MFLMVFPRAFRSPLRRDVAVRKTPGRTEMVRLALRAMAAHAGPTDEDHGDAVRLVLLGLATGEDHDSITDRLGQLHLPDNTFPAEVLLELAAEATGESGATQAQPTAND